MLSWEGVQVGSCLGRGCGGGPSRCHRAPCHAIVFSSLPPDPHPPCFVVCGASPPLRCCHIQRLLSQLFRPAQPLHKVAPNSISCTPPWPPPCACAPPRSHSLQWPPISVLSSPAPQLLYNHETLLRLRRSSQVEHVLYVQCNLCK